MRIVATLAAAAFLVAGVPVQSQETEPDSSSAGCCPATTPKPLVEDPRPGSCATPAQNIKVRDASPVAESAPGRCAPPRKGTAVSTNATQAGDDTAR